MRHNYFRSGLLERATIKASPITEQTMRNYGLAWKQARGQMAVLYDAEGAGSEEKLQALLADGVKLQFWLYLDDVALLNYTDLPFVPQDRVYYFSNALSPARPSGNQVGLTRGNHVGDNDTVALFQGNTVMLVHKNKKDNNNAVLDIFNHPTGTITERPNGMEVNGFEDEGGYYVWNDGKAEYPFFVDKLFGWQKPFAVLEFHFSKRVRESARPIKDDLTVKPLEYTLDFNRRAVYWKYYIMSDHLRDLDGLAIANGKSGIHFIGPQKEQVLGKHESETFFSDKPLDFTEERTYKFQLHKNFDEKKGGGKTVIKALPNPQPEQLKPMTEKPGEFYTEIFIY